MPCFASFAALLVGSNSNATPQANAPRRSSQPEKEEFLLHLRDGPGGLARGVLVGRHPPVPSVYCASSGSLGPGIFFKMVVAASRV